MARYIYFAPALNAAGILEDDRLAAALERHRIVLAPPPMTFVGDPDRRLRDERGVEGVVLSLTKGFLERPQLAVAAAALRRGLRVWTYWPSEHAIECVDSERLTSARVHWLAINLLERFAAPMGRWVTRWRRVAPALRWVYRGEFAVRRFDILARLNQLSEAARPVPLAAVPSRPGEK